MTLGETLHNINELIFVKNKKITSIVGIFVILIAVFTVFSFESNLKKGEMLGQQEIRNLIGDGSGGGGGGNIPGTEDFVEKSEVISDDNSLRTGGADNYEVTASSTKVITKITASATWKDEPDIQRLRLYENQPDTFSVTIEAPDGTVLNTQSSSNTHGGTGTATASHILTEEEASEYLGSGNFTVIVVLEESGSYTPRAGISVIVLTDGENDYDISIDVEYLAPAEAE